MDYICAYLRCIHLHLDILSLGHHNQVCIRIGNLREYFYRWHLCDFRNFAEMIETNHVTTWTQSIEGGPSFVLVLMIYKGSVADVFVKTLENRIAEISPQLATRALTHFFLAKCMYFTRLELHCSQSHAIVGVDR